MGKLFPRKQDDTAKLEPTGATFFAAATKQEKEPAPAPVAVEPTEHADDAPAQKRATFLSVTAGQGAISGDSLARFGAMSQLSTARRAGWTTDFGGGNDRVKAMREEQNRKQLDGLLWSQGLPRR